MTRADSAAVLRRDGAHARGADGEELAVAAWREAALDRAVCPHGRAVQRFEVLHAPGIVVVRPIARTLS